MQLKNIIGDFGQKIARDFFQKRGYKIRTENFFTQNGEIDLIVEKDSQIVFAEVKTRLSDKFGLPEEAIDKKKIGRLRLAALKYLAEAQIGNDNYRFDCVAVEIDKKHKKAKIRHHKNFI